MRDEKPGSMNFQSQPQSSKRKPEEHRESYYRRDPGAQGKPALQSDFGARRQAALQGLAGDGGLNFLFVYVEVGVNVLHVVVIFQSLDHTDHLLCLLAAQLHVILRHPAYFRG
jgi:hypothetical protein